MLKEITTKKFLIYGSESDGAKIDVLVKDDTIWLTQAQIATLFNVQPQAISRHLKNIYADNELIEQSTCSKMEQVRREGERVVTRNLVIYNLDAIIAVGYRINSKQATAFRIWATKVLKEYMIKGFALDDERLKMSKSLTGQDYFRELLERVHSIRASEQRMYLQITEIFKECSIDYDSNSKITSDFFANIQNLFHFAITGKTAAEIIYEKSDHTKPSMGLETWRDAPDGRIYKSDVATAKNYLSEKQLKELERTVSGFFDYIERQIELHVAMTMSDMAKLVIKFLTFNDYKILDGRGRVSMKVAKEKAHAEYDVFNKTQPIGEDFKKFVKKISKS